MVHQDRPARAARARWRSASSAAYARSAVVARVRHGPEHSSVQRADRRPEHGHVLAERARLAARRSRAEDERTRRLPVRSAGSVTLARRLARAAALVRDGQRERQSPRLSATARATRPRTGRCRPGRTRATIARTTNAEKHPDDRDAVDLRRRHVAETERVAPLAQPDVDRHGRAAAGAADGSARAAPGAVGGATVCGGGHVADGATNRRRRPTSARPPRPARRRRRSSGRGRSRRRRRPPASAPTSRVAPGSTACRAIASSPSQSPWNPTSTRWSSRRRPARVERLEVERQVRLEVVVERGPAVADPAGQAGAGRRLATEDDRRRRRRDRVCVRLVAAGRTASPRVIGPAGPQGPDDRDGLLEPGDPLGRRREVDAVGLVLLRRAADADAEDQAAAARDLERGGHPRDDRRDGGS